ncbi:MAG: FAD-dependent thymidylate synthase [Spirochaetia bacterium]|jgi:thymidylate synthase (FAD)|nr:FAD-dependent thymidylate synthase [Spirochaetia bacterium]
MAHCIAADGEQLLDKEIKVLDKGFVRLVDYLGDDSRIVQSARVSYGEGTKSYREDKGLIDYLLRNDHTSPFEQVSFTFHIKMPIVVARQWIRHRTAKVNEISGRYSVMESDFYVPAAEDIALQSEDNKQGRQNKPVSAELAKEIQNIISAEQDRVYETYTKLLGMGLAREIARINLPLSLYTEWYWTMDLHNLFHFLRLRMDAHAQKEIRVYANAIFEIVKKITPMAAEAFEKHLLTGTSLSGSELEAVKVMTRGEDCPLKSRAKEILFAKLGMNQ